MRPSPELSPQEQKNHEALNITLMLFDRNTDDDLVADAVQEADQHLSDPGIYAWLRRVLHSATPPEAMDFDLAIKRVKSSEGGDHITAFVAEMQENGPIISQLQDAWSTAAKRTCLIEEQRVTAHLAASHEGMFVDLTAEWKDRATRGAEQSAIQEAMTDTMADYIRGRFLPRKTWRP